MQINPYLQFNGNCDEAFAFYAQCFGGKVGFKMTYAESPMAAQTPPALVGKVMHASMVIHGQVLMGTDLAPDQYEKVKGITMTISPTTPAEAEQIFNALSAGGKVGMPLQPTFWAQSFGMFEDRFGIPWMVSCAKTPA